MEQAPDLAVGAAYFAGDLAVPGGLDAPTRFIRGESTFAQAVADQRVSAGVEMTAGFAMGKVFRVGKRLGSALVKGEKTLAKAVVEKIAERKVGQVGKYIDLTEKIRPLGGFKDGMQVHHMPSQRWLTSHGMDTRKGFSATMAKEQHKKTRTYKWKAAKLDVSSPYRIEIGRDLANYVRILKADGSWTPEVRRSLMQGLGSFKQEFPDLFKKVTK